MNLNQKLNAYANRANFVNKDSPILYESGDILLFTDIAIAKHFFFEDNICPEMQANEIQCSS